MNERIGVDGKPYAIGFEMRLPTAWNGRFFYQANGGLDGFVTPAYGDILGGAPDSNGLLKGFAVISSDAGHAFDRTTPIGGATFGLDPQARLDYGYNAVAQLTPMAKALIAAYYGKGPDRSYFVGTSNGGRHGFVTAQRAGALRRARRRGRWHRG
jgi:feruloyl esterase